MKKALIAMSGGVDSSLVAKLMKDMGFQCSITSRMAADSFHEKSLRIW